MQLWVLSYPFEAFDQMNDAVISPGEVPVPISAPLLEIFV